ncbi:MAG: biotin synthase BioB [Bacteroidia bacterium]|nr:biotin synthase BioB [Bacteroidia bacterium]
MDLQELYNRIISGGRIRADEACSLVRFIPKQQFYDLADSVRKHFTGNRFDLCSIVNARSGRCSEDCKWCAQSSYYKTSIEEYDLVDHDHAVDLAIKNEKYGVHKYSLVTSGKTITCEKLNELCKIYADISKISKITLCASMGLIGREMLQMLKDAGVKQYHCNLETASSFFKNLCTTHTFEEKLQTLEWAKEVGLHICSGGIIGMGETMEQRIELAFELNRVGVKSIPLNILYPIEGTPLQNYAQLSDEEVLTTIAIFRLINPDAQIRFAGGRQLIKHIQDKALKAGINASLVGDLLTTVGSNVEEDIAAFREAGFEF